MFKEIFGMSFDIWQGYSEMPSLHWNYKEQEYFIMWNFICFISIRIVIHIFIYISSNCYIYMCIVYIDDTLINILYLIYRYILQKQGDTYYLYHSSIPIICISEYIKAVCWWSEKCCYRNNTFWNGVYCNLISC